MHSSRALCSLRSIFPPINQRLPLSKAESRQLLESIKTSFRTELEKHHGPFVDLDAAPAQSKPTISYLPSETATSPLGKHSSARATDRHLHAIVNNPLFNLIGAERPTGGYATTWDAHKDVFERAVSRGLMTVPIASGFLRLVKTEVQRTTTPSILDGLRQTGAGLLVLQWLRSSGHERDLSFLTNRPFTRLLMEFAVAEGLDDVAWVWIDRLMKQEHAPAGAVAPPALATEVFSALVKAKNRALGLEGSFAAILKGGDLAREHSMSPTALRYAWARVAFLATVYSWRYSVPSADLFDPFVAMGEKYSLVLDTAHLNLHHPVNPSPDLALDLLSDETQWNQINEEARRRGQGIVHRVRLLGLDTVEHLTNADQLVEASRFFELLKRRLIQLPSF